MKQILIVLLSVLMIQGCKTGSDYVVKGNGKVVSYEIPVDNYSQIAMSGSGELIYEQKTNRPAYVKIEIDENLKDLIYIKSRGSKLIISDDNISSSKLKIHTNSGSLKDLKISGSGNVTLKNEINVPDLKVTISGAGDLKANKLRCSNFKLFISGVGNADLAGDIYSSDIRISGKGNVEAFKLKTRGTECRISGVGYVKVYASEYLSSRISGSGTIEYKGSPKRKDNKVSGAGEIKSK